MQGKLIIFEGVEGCGKTTQIQLTSQWLQSLGIEAVVTREPGGTELGVDLRRLLLETGKNHIASRTELLLYAADRAQHVEQELKPNLASGKFVLCDRFIYSTIAYQGYGRSLDMDLINQLNQIATAGLVSDLVFWFDVDAEIGLQRKRSSGEIADRIEEEKIDFHKRVQQGYGELAKTYPEFIIRIDASLSKESIQQQIQDKLSKVIIN
ncbi:dTMP kinase [Calothrix sp. UHCC 0171]|uniref:dTMP kinase n=1 Tax=Calothrix sp. UHCC 0171 TaxID=3110245 RepID=UPI002B21C4D5|nr:dTMP kinase [Calothrix sp. UHCC 0171]MEA5574158.1 dTMP kinase [Calothrix sp. UHCC 0171]